MREGLVSISFRRFFTPRALRRSVPGRVRARLIGLIVMALFGMPYFGPLVAAGGQAFASLGDGGSSTLELVRPGADAAISDGNLALIEALAIDRVDGKVDRVEIAINSEDDWHEAQRAEEDPTRWRFLWSDP